MQKVVQVMFPITKVFAYFDSSEFDLVINDLVIVETESGLDLGIIKKASYMEKEENVIFAGRLAKYKYYNMDLVVKDALEIFENEIR